MKQNALARNEEYYTPEEYIAFERDAEEKHEYSAGEIIAMAGATRAHNLITGNLSQRLLNRLEGKPYETYANAMRVRATPTAYVYPDVVVVCGEPQFEDDEFDTLLNPLVVFEVLSKSTEARDRGAKFADYRAIASVTDIVFVSQYRMRVEHYVKRAGGEWVLRDVTEPDATVRLDSLDCTLTLAEIYERVKLPPPRQLKSVKGE
jgi:Uma2 family endonuclease